MRDVRSLRHIYICLVGTVRLSLRYNLKFAKVCQSWSRKPVITKNQNHSFDIYIYIFLLHKSKEQSSARGDADSKWIWSWKQRIILWKVLLKTGFQRTNAFQPKYIIYCLYVVTKGKHIFS